MQINFWINILYGNAIEHHEKRCQFLRDSSNLIGVAKITTGSQ